MSEGWTIDEFAHAGSEHLDPDFVAGYDRKQAFDPSADVAILRACGLGRESTLVDLGAGTGTFTLAAAVELGRVVAVDVSPVMIDALERRVAASGRTNVDCVEGSFLTSLPVGFALDAVYTRNALHQLPDFWKAIALDRIGRLLRPGGFLFVRDLIYDFPPDEAEAAFDRWFAGAVDDPTIGYTRDDFMEHIRTEHSTFRWLFEPMLDAAGFDVAAVGFVRSVYGAYTCVKR